MSQIMVEKKSELPVPPSPPPRDNTWKYVAGIAFLGYSIGYGLDDYGAKYPLSPRLQLLKSLSMSSGMCALVMYIFFKSS